MVVLPFFAIISLDTEVRTDDSHPSTLRTKKTEPCPRPIQHNSGALKKNIIIHKRYLQAQK